MRRPLVLVVVAAGTLAGLVIFLSFLTIAPVSAVPLETADSVYLETASAVSERIAQDSQPGRDPLSAPMELFVNYAHDWVAGNTIPSTTVLITLWILRKWPSR